jgi:hypothetical protein
MTETQLALVRPEELPKAWRACAPLIDAALDYNGRNLPRRFETTDIRERVADGRFQLWLAVGDGAEAVCITEILNYPRCKVFSVVILTGQYRGRWLHHIETMFSWAAAQGCTRAEAWARPGWARVLKGYGLRMTHALIEKGLSDVARV